MYVCVRVLGQFQAQLPQAQLHYNKHSYHNHNHNSLNSLNNDNNNNNRSEETGRAKRANHGSVWLDPADVVGVWIDVGLAVLGLATSRSFPPRATAPALPASTRDVIGIA